MKIFLGIIIGFLLAAAIAATAFKAAWGDLADIGARERGEDATRTVEAADFDAIEAAGVFELEISVGGDYAVALAGREEDLARTTAVVENGVLVLDTAERDGEGKRRFVKHGVTATISLPALKSIDAAGVVDGEVKGVDSETFSADISGVGELDLAGVCGTLTADVSGVGELDAEDLECRIVDVEVSGVGAAKVFASQSVDAELAGIGKIEISGSPAEVSKTKTSPLGRISVK
jgi:hypothetical protein